MGQAPARDRGAPSGGPSPPGPRHTSSSVREFIKSTIHIKDGIVLIRLAPILRAKIETLRRIQGDPLGEILHGLRIEELERALGYKYYIYVFRISGECLDPPT